MINIDVLFFKNVLIYNYFVALKIRVIMSSAGGQLLDTDRPVVELFVKVCLLCLYCYLCGRVLGHSKTQKWVYYSVSVVRILSRGTRYRFSTCVI